MKVREFINILQTQFDMDDNVGVKTLYQTENKVYLKAIEVVSLEKNMGNYYRCIIQPKEDVTIIEL